jgi:hypothetical protein
MIQESVCLYLTSFSIIYKGDLLFGKIKLNKIHKYIL